MIKNTARIFASIFLSIALILDQTLVMADTEPLKSTPKPSDKTPQPTSPASKPIEYNVTVTASVPLSDLWANAIKNNSQARLIEEKPINNSSIFEVQIIGLNNEIMENASVKAYIYQNDYLIDIITQKTDQTGKTIFLYTPKEHGNYKILFTYVSWDKEVTLSKHLDLAI